MSEKEVKKVVPIITDRRSSLSIRDVEHHIIYKQHNSEMPFRPKGGDVYVFHPRTDTESRDWVADGHSFSCEGTRKVKGNSGEFKKYYYYLHIATEGRKRLTDKRFRKEVYAPLSQNFKNIAVIHYLGDESVSKPKPHGNSTKRTKISVRTKPSVLKKIQESVQNTHKSAHKIYKEAVLAEENADVTKIPRNVRQFHYIKEKNKTDERPTKDAIVNLQAIAYEDKGFVHYIATFLDLVAVIGMEEMFHELNECLQIAPKIEQLLSYDTTFSMGDFYISVVLFKHQAFEEKPVLPALFMVHERKFQSHHELVFATLRNYCKSNLANVPIAIDMERGILNAIEAETNLKVVGCTYKIREFDSVTEKLYNRGRKKPGRKRPRPGDHDVEYKYPEDSAVKSTESKHHTGDRSSSVVGVVTDNCQVSIQNIRANVESAGVTLTEESMGRIQGNVDNG